MSKSRGSPRKFSEKIALLCKKEAEGNAEFERIIKEVEETTRASPNITSSSSAFPSRTSSFSNSSWIDDTRSAYIEEYQPQNNQHHPHLNHQQHLHNQHHHHSQNLHHQQTQGYSTGVANIAIASGASINSEPYASNHHIDDATPIQLQHQHHLSTTNSVTGPPIEHLSIQTPPGVPNIEIFPINEDSSYQQQVLDTSGTSNNYSRIDCSSHISAARSLPDIANLRVSSNSFTALAPSYSDQRITSAEYNFNYDANSNIVTSSDTQNYCSLDANSHQPHQQQQPQLQDHWQQQIPIDFDEAQQHQINHQSSQQNYYHQPPQEIGTSMVRASSTNAMLNGCWHSCNNDMLNPPRINNNLSKSTEFCYVYPEEYTDT